MNKSLYCSLLFALGQILLSNEAVPMPKVSTYKGLTVSTANGRIILPYDDIIYMVAEGKTVTVHTLQNGVLRTHRTLGELDTMLPPNLFYRVHRSFIIAYRCITCIHPHTVSLNGKYHIPIGRVYAAALRASYIHL